MNAESLRVVVTLWIVAMVAGGYAESFPNRPVAWEQSGYVAQGIVCGNAVRERELVVNRNQNFLPYCGVWQPYIVSLQQELETLAPMYIDHENGPLTDAEDDFLYFTLDSWRATAGLNVNGFRRSVDGTTMLYGQMQAGDVIGAWIFEDLQKGFDALKWLPLFGYIENVRQVFPTVTGGAVFTGNGQGGAFGVYYNFWSGHLGGSGTYNIVLDRRSFGGAGMTDYISLGRGAGYYGWDLVDVGCLAFDTKATDPSVRYSYSASLTLNDPTTLVEVFGCINKQADPGSANIASSFTQSSISLSADFETEHEPASAWIFFPVVKPPFANYIIE